MVRLLPKRRGRMKKKYLLAFFHLFYKPCLIDIVAVVLAYSHEVHHTIRYAFCLIHRCHFCHDLDALCVHKGNFRQTF